MYLSKLSTVSNGNLIGHSLDIKNFTLDSRNIKQGDLYIALQGTNFDGHDFIDEALKKDLELVTTEKDYFRIKDYGFKNIKFLKIKLEILENDKFLNQILNYS